MDNQELLESIRGIVREEIQKETKGIKKEISNLKDGINGLNGRQGEMYKLLKELKKDFENHEHEIVLTSGEMKLKKAE